MNRYCYPIIGREERLPFYLTGIGISDPEYHVQRAQGQGSHQLLFTVSGTGCLEVGGVCYPQKIGSCFYLAPNLPHAYHGTCDRWVTAWVVFRGDALDTVMPRLGFEACVCTCRPDTTGLRPLFDELFAVAQEPMRGGVRCSALLYAFILAAEAVLCEPPSAGDSDTPALAAAYMDAHFAEEITLERLAGITGVSLQHFCRVFRAELGMRPMEYLARRRLTTAKQLLCGTTESIAGIGAAVGYASPTYFGIVFRKYEGISPSEYRKTHASMLL